LLAESDAVLKLLPVENVGKGSPKNETSVII